MATTTYINGNMETLAAAMQQLVTMGYFASVEYDDSGTYPAVVCKDADENAVVTIAQSGASNTTVTLRFDDGTTQATGFTANGSLPYYLYICSGGAYVSFNASNVSLSSGFIISKTNNNKIGCILLAHGSSGVATYRLSTVRSTATNDDTTQTGTNFVFGAPTRRNQTTLMNIPTCSPPTVVSFFPDVCYTFTSQYPFSNSKDSPPQNFTQDGKRYLWIGYYAIRDEEES